MEIKITSNDYRVWINRKGRALGRFIRDHSYSYESEPGAPLVLKSAIWGEFVNSMVKVFGIDQEELEKHKPLMVCLSELLVLMGDVDRESQTGKALLRKLKPIVHAPDKTGIEQLKREVIRKGYGKG